MTTTKLPPCGMITVFLTEFNSNSKTSVMPVLSNIYTKCIVDYNYALRTVSTNNILRSKNTSVQFDLNKILFKTK